jgi:parallel beta-helix repeat protein
MRNTGERETMITTIKAFLSGLRCELALLSVLATLVIVATPIASNAQSVGEMGTSMQAVTGISQPGNFPIKISKSGSYRLNSNLTVKKSGVDAIDVSVPNVTIDLSGFTITGGVIAINGLTSVAANVTVSNGSITGAVGGVLLSDGAVVRNVRVSNLTGAGTGFFNAITCGNSCTLSGNTVYNVTVSNPGGPPAAMATGNNSLILNNSVTGTVVGTGIAVGVGGNSVVSGNISSSNANSGILLGGSGVIVTHNTADNNTTGLSFGLEKGGYEDNVLLNNTTDVSGGTSLAGGNTNLCTSGVC